ncbi:hypothetical protein CgunFtcFv8_022724 [Champsocephalus gunnari]|uniref:Uncharacterized protein n=1 Tax=Champsocephalus gunnari TaxID=52237 RepID=A0AAN8DQG4_CHAGU|nr:hypothetical protein CgunFtcFv8_022724 [Champsocephalus gunnari]
MRRRCKTSLVTDESDALSDSETEAATETGHETHLLECDRDSQMDTEESDALSEMETAAEIEFETNLLVHALDAGANDGGR